MRTTSATAVLRNPFSSIEAAIAARSRSRCASTREASAPGAATSGVAAPGAGGSPRRAAVAGAGTLGGGALAANDDARAVARDHRDVALTRAFGRRVGRLEVDALHDRAQHDTLLGHRKRRAEAAADASAEGDPRVGARLVSEEALGAEGMRFGIHVLAVVKREDAHGDGGVGRDDVLAETPRLLDQAHDDRDHGPYAHAL